MYSVMIVDDEVSIREKLPKLVDFERYGFSVCATAKNGAEALALLPEHQPDLLFLDVRMPVMDGLALLEALQDSPYRDVYVVILSGYSDFAYAKRAMEHGVKAYLTKPVDEDEAEKVLADIAQKLDRRNLRQLQTTYRDDLATLRNIANESEGIFVSDQYHLLHLLPIGIQTNDETVRAYQLILQRMMDKIGLEEDGLFRKAGHIHSFLAPKTLVGSSVLDFRHFASSFGDILRAEGLSCAFLLDAAALDNADTSFWTTFTSHMSLMIRTLFYEGTTVIWHDKADVPPPAVSPAFAVSITDALAVLRKGAEGSDEARALEGLEKVFSLVLRDTPDLYEVMAITDRIYYLLVSLLSSAQSEATNNPLLFRIVLKETPVFWEVDKWRDMLTRQVKTALGILRQNRHLQYAGLNNGLLDYVHHHYHSPLSLKQVAEQFHMNTAYMGRYFQKATGVSFKQYINHLRMTEAKRLLQGTDKLVYEIAEEVGFSDSSYFVTRFTGDVGVTPLEYRNRHTKGRNDSTEK